MIFLDTKPKGVPFTNIQFSCGRAFSADCGNFPNDSPQASIPFQNPVPLISATQSCHIHPITKHQIIDLDVFPWSLDPETSPVESIVLENSSFFFHRHAIFIPSQNTKSSIWTCSRGPWTLIACGEYRFGGLFDFFSRKGEKKSPTGPLYLGKRLRIGHESIQEK